MDPELKAQIEKAQGILAQGAPGLTLEERGKLQDWVDSVVVDSPEGESPPPVLAPDDVDVGDKSAPPLDAPGGIIPEIGRKVVSPAMTMAEHYTQRASLGASPHLAAAGDELSRQLNTWAGMDVPDQTYAERAAERTEAHPTAAFLGDVAGYMTGLGPRLVAKGVGGALRLIPGMGALTTASESLSGPWARGMASAAAREGIVGAAEGAAVPLVEAGVEATATGEPYSEGLGDKMTEDALIGAGLGSGMGLLGYGGGRLYRALRDPAKHPNVAKTLRQLEAGGGSTTAPSLTGVRPPEGYEDLARQSIKEAEGTVVTSGLPSDEALEPAARATQKGLAHRHAQTEARHVEEATPYYNSPEGRAGVELTETLDELTRAYARRKDLPFDADSATDRLLSHIDKMTEMRIVPKGSPPPPGKTYKVSLEDYRQLFPPEEVDRALLAARNAPGSGLARRGGDAMAPAPTPGTGLARRDQLARGPEEVFASARDIPGGSGMPGPMPGGAESMPGGAGDVAGAVDVYLVPKKMSAEQFDTMERSLQFMKEGKAEPDAAKFQRTLLRDRDQFPSNSAAPAPAEPIRFPDGSESRSGWTAMKDRHTRELSEFEAMGFSTGLRAGETPDARSTAQMLRIQEALQGMAGEGRSAGRDKFIARLVRDYPEAKEAIQKFLASRSFERFQKGGATPRMVVGQQGMPQMYLGGGLNALRFNLDPLMRRAPGLGRGEHAGHAAQLFMDEDETGAQR